MTDASPARPEERIDSTAQGAMPAKAPARAAGGLAADAHASPTRDRHLGRAPDAHQQAAELPTAVSPASSPTKPARSPISPASRAKVRCSQCCCPHIVYNVPVALTASSSYQ